VSQLIDTVAFPLNYQWVFLCLSAGGLISLMYSLRIQLPDNPPPPPVVNQPLRQWLAGYLELIRGQPAFLSFSAKRLVYLAAVSMALPVFPLYFVRQVHLSDGWISSINLSVTSSMLAGYLLWAYLSRKRGSRFVLLRTTLGLACYPALAAVAPFGLGLCPPLAAAVPLPVWLMLFAGLGGIFQAGLDLVFFDELMRTVPPEHSALFVSLAQSLQNLAAFVAPLLGTLLSDYITPAGALLVCAVLRLIGFALFALGRKV